MDEEKNKKLKHADYHAKIEYAGNTIFRCIWLNALTQYPWYCTSGKASRISFRIGLVPRVRQLVYVDQETGDIVISPLQEHANMTYTAVLFGRDVGSAEAEVKRWTFTASLVVPAFPFFDGVLYSKPPYDSNSWPGYV